MWRDVIAEAMTIGKPDVGRDVGITDPDPMWKAKGEYWRCYSNL